MKFVIKDKQDKQSLINYLKELGNPSVVTNWDMNKLIQIYNRVFHKKRRVSSCGSCMKVVLDELHKLMDEYETEN